MSDQSANLLGHYLQNCRRRLDPEQLGFAPGRRRTPGLRREEVAQRANISPTWYTWLEQGRGGGPSAEVLNRIAQSLMLSEPEREHLFMLAFGHPPEASYRAPVAVTPRLQRLLDTLDASPAIIKSATWDVLAWNHAAARVLTDYSLLPADQRNILRLIFCAPHIRRGQRDWESTARAVVSAFRADAVRAGAQTEIKQLVDELCAASPEFAALWLNNDVSQHAEGIKCLYHATLGPLELEYSSFSVDGHPALSLMVFNPVHPRDALRLRQYLATTP
ncbi:helix-turn-helix transcriptional regulator [Pantoea sp. A4]|uniref:helix-turn-helix transcriptional regulator n=1 Tax=Pantoea sp. A4 TaxID=1225184 RepID=UPI000360D6AF|nr:helix-turn-helix transcriptional regulator [Pantoea sp. A4]